MYLDSYEGFTIAIVIEPVEVDTLPLESVFFKTVIIKISNNFQDVSIDMSSCHLLLERWFPGYPVSFLLSPKHF